LNAAQDTEESMAPPTQLSSYAELSPNEALVQCIQWNGTVGDLNRALSLGSFYTLAPWADIGQLTVHVRTIPSKCYASKNQTITIFRNNVLPSTLFQDNDSEDPYVQGDVKLDSWQVEPRTS